MKKKLLGLLFIGILVTGCGEKKDINAFAHLANDYVSKEIALIYTLTTEKDKVNATNLTKNKDYLELQDLAKEIKNYSLETSSGDDVDLFDQFKAEMEQIENINKMYLNKEKPMEELSKKINYDKLQELIMTMQKDAQK